MGLIKAIAGAVKSTMADQWKEYFYCDALSANILVAKGQKRTGEKSSNNGTDNIISNGSTIAVNEGQCMIIVDQGKVVEFCAEAGEFTWDASTEPSLFSGKLGQSIVQTFKTIGKRFTYGGDTAKDQRVYYFNTKEILDNKYGTATPVPFRVVDKNIGLDIDISIRCNGQYSYKIVDPILFYTNVCGNVVSTYNRSEIDSTLKSELLSALQPAFAKISEEGIRYSALPGHTIEISNALNECLSDQWSNLRGIEVAAFSINSVSASQEDENMIKEVQRMAILRDPSLAGATLVGAQAEAMKAAANNAGGAMMGFMGLGMANQAGGVNAANLYAMGQQNQAQAAAAPATPAAAPANAWTCSCGATATGKFCPECGKAKPQPQPSNAWTCSCGATATGKFCPECGKPKPSDDTWTCSCGAVNKGKFCSECGKGKPAAVKSYKCSKCGWVPADPTNPPKFCPECGHMFDDLDVQ